MANLIPDGTFCEAVAVEVEGEIARWGRAGQNNTPQVLIYFEILDGDHRGRRVPWFGYFTKTSYKRTMEALRYCGWKSSDVRKLGDLDQKVSIEIECDEYEGKTRNRVKWVNRPGGGAMKLNNPMTPDDLRDFAARMQKYATEVASVDGDRVDRGGSAPPPVDDRQPMGGPGVDDDIPF